MQQWQTRPLTGEGLGRILAGAPQKSDLDLEKLREDLEWARILYLTRQEFRSRGPELQKKIDSLAKAVRRVELLLDDKQVRKEIARHKRFNEQDPRELILLLRTAVERPSSHCPPTEPPWARQAAGQFIHELGMGERSAFEWLVGQYLPHLFQEHFGRRAGRSRGTHGLGGPYMRFAKQVLIELGITNHDRAYSDESISKALSKPRPDRGRRK
jgi:hypothetical protein